MINGVRELHARTQLRNTVANYRAEITVEKLRNESRDTVIVSGKEFRRLCLVPQSSDHVPSSI